jgi:Autotransporter beta-domain
MKPATTAFVTSALLLIPAFAHAQRDRPAVAAPDYDRAYQQPEEDKPKEEPVDHREHEAALFSVGVGAGVPRGSAMKDTGGTALSMRDVVSADFPLSLGLGVRLGPVVYIGLAFEHAFLTTNNCDQGSSCSASDTRIGIEGRFHLMPGPPFSPWVALGCGYEFFSLSESGALAGDTSLHGWDFDVQLGGDIQISRAFSLAPFVGIRFGTFSTATVDTGTTKSGDIPDSQQATHEWLTFGLRGTFSLLQQPPSAKH